MQRENEESVWKTAKINNFFKYFHYKRSREIEQGPEVNGKSQDVYY
jgi:hypothetical protein